MTEQDDIMSMRVEDTSQTIRGIEILIEDRLDAHSAPDLRSAVVESLESGITDVIVDLSEVDFVDSAGLAALVNAMKRTQALGGLLTVVRPRSAEAFRVFELTRFDRVFILTDDINEARQRSRTTT